MICYQSAITFDQVVIQLMGIRLKQKLSKMTLSNLHLELLGTEWITHRQQGHHIRYVLFSSNSVQSPWYCVVILVYHLEIMFRHISCDVVVYPLMIT